jgi:tRNA (guanine37-N1)-methyltransferase
MHFDVITLFPGIFQGPLQESLLSKALDKGLLSIEVHNLRDWCYDKHKTADDSPYGGGPGMVMKPDPLFEAIEAVKNLRKEPKVIFLSPKGRVFTQDVAKELVNQKELILLCGRYEGIDERVRETLVDDEISIGDYVLNGGELPALVLIETISRLIPGVVGDEQSVIQDSFYAGLLDHPHYTRPAEFRGMKVPEVLLNGNHQEVDKWRRKMALLHTLRLRPDLLENIELSKEDRKLLEEAKQSLHIPPDVKP